MTEETTMSLDPSIELYVEAALGKKAAHVVLLDVRELTSMADAFLICSGRSNRQVTAIAEFVLRYLKKRGKQPLSIEGKKEGHWVLLDYGEVIIHIFYEPLRTFYDLEGLWADARRIRTNGMLKHEEGSTGDQTET